MHADAHVCPTDNNKTRSLIRLFFFLCRVRFLDIEKYTKYYKMTLFSRIRTRKFLNLFIFTRCGTWACSDGHKAGIMAGIFQLLMPSQSTKGFFTLSLSSSSSSLHPCGWENTGTVGMMSSARLFCCCCCRHCCGDHRFFSRPDSHAVPPLGCLCFRCEATSCLSPSRCRRSDHAAPLGCSFFLFVKLSPPLTL